MQGCVSDSYHMITWHHAVQASHMLLIFFADIVRLEGRVSLKNTHLVMRYIVR